MIKGRYSYSGNRMSSSGLDSLTYSGSTVTTRRYSGSCIFEGATLKKVLFEGGYAQMSGSTPTYMFFLTDHLGSVRVVANQSGTVLQTNQYGPFGDLINDANVAEVASDNRYRFTGKERSAETLLHDFGARYLDTSVGRFTTIDPLAEKYPAISPYAYCAGDPVNMVDPDGRKIKGVTKDDAYKFRDDIYSVLSDEKFAGVRSLLDVKGKSFIKIDSSALESTLNAISLTEDETAYITMISNAINSSSTFSIEYVTGEFTSYEGANAFAAYMNKELGEKSGNKMLTPDGKLSSGWINNYGNGLNVPTHKGSHSFVIDNLSGNERTVTSGHELLGHGFSAAKGIIGDENHSNAIRTDNLIRRLLGMPQRDGHDHNGTITNPYIMPLIK